MKLLLIMNVTNILKSGSQDGGSQYGNITFNSTEDFQSFILPVYRQVLWIVVFGGMVVVATIGNLVVIWTVMINKSMKSITNYFLVNLAVADAMISTLNVTFNFAYMLYLDWPFGHFYCKFSQFVAVISISASVLTLMAISIDRYMAIVNPLRPRVGKRVTLTIIISIWSFSAFISVPNLIYFTTDVDTLPDGTIRYNLVFTIFTYFLPIGAMIFTYVKVGIELWGSKSIGESTERQLGNIKSKRRIVKMLIVVVVIFAVCWLPFHFYFLITSHYPEIVEYKHIQEIYLAIYWLAMSNSMYNPIIYCWMNTKFRNGFKQFFKGCNRIDTIEYFNGQATARSARSLTPSMRKNDPMRMSMYSTHNNTMISST